MQEAVNCVIFGRDRSNILLIMRRDIPVWVLPGGGIEKNETPEAAVAREAFEETGFRIRILRKVAVYHPQNRITSITHLFDCEIIEGAPERGSETQDLHFFPIDQLPKYLVPLYRGWIQDALKVEPALLEKKMEGTTYWHLLKFLLLHPILVIRFLLTRIGIHFNK